MNFSDMMVFGLNKKIRWLTSHCQSTASLTANHADLALCATLGLSGEKDELNTITSNEQEIKYFSFSFFINSVCKIEAP